MSGLSEESPDQKAKGKRTANSRECWRRTSLGILAGVDSNFHQMLKILCYQQESMSDQVQLSKSLLATLQLQGACIVKVITDEISYLESNRKSFPDDFVDHNISACEFWQEFFSKMGSLTYPVLQSGPYVRSALESFMLFADFYRSLDSVLKAWPIPAGYSYPRTSDRLDTFLDAIPVPPSIAYSLGYTPKLSRSELRSVIAEEYRKVSRYLSSHLENVDAEIFLAIPEVKTEPYETFRVKLQGYRRKQFKPVEAKIAEYAWKMDEMEGLDYGTNLHAELVYATEQVLSAEHRVRTLNSKLQTKMATYMADLYQGVKRRISSMKIKTVTSYLSVVELEPSKGAFLGLLSRWEDALDEVLDLNRNGVLEIVTNVHDLEAELHAHVNSAQTILI